MSRLDQKLLLNSYLWLTPAPFLTFANSFAKFPQRRAYTHCIISPSIHSYSYLVQAFLGFYTYEVGCRSQPALGLLQFGDLATVPPGFNLPALPTVTLLGHVYKTAVLCSPVMCLPVVPLLLSPTVTCHFC